MLSTIFSLCKSHIMRLPTDIGFATMRDFTTHTYPLYFKATELLWGEPLKKKKRLDPAIIKRRMEKKKKKLEKAIRKLEKVAKTLKPIQEMEVPCELYNDKKRIRNVPPITSEIAEQRILLHKKWSVHKILEHRKNIRTLESIQISQFKALDELRKESEDLYQAAIQLDLTFLPVEVSGPSLTPPIENYDSPDGDYIDVTKKYEGE